MQATSSVRRSPVGVLAAATALLAALMLGGAGGYALKSAIGQPASTIIAPVPAKAPTVSAPAGIRVGTYGSAGEARKKLRLAD